MANLKNYHLLLLKNKYEEQEKKDKDKKMEIKQNQIADNVQQEGFFELPRCDDVMFVSGVCDIIIKDYAAVGYQESELSQMWRVFRKLYNNGVNPEDNLSMQLYLKLAKEMVTVSQGIEKPIVSRLEVRDKADLIVTGLDSFDTSKYFFRTLRVLEQEEKYGRNFYVPYYKQFISTIASLCPSEDLLYSIIAQRVATPTQNGRQIDRAREIVQSGRDIEDFLRFEGHSTIREDRGNFFGFTSRDLIEKHDTLTDNRLISYEREIKGQVPQYIKIPSFRRYM